MDGRVQAAFDSLRERMEREARLYAELPRAEVERRIDEFMLPIGPDTGRLLHLLILAARCRNLLEIGTSAGYSTLWLADAARANGGHVTTLDANPTKHDQARELVEGAGLTGSVTFHTGDALVSLRALPGPWDFVLLDVGRGLYLPCLEGFQENLAPGALIAADNMTSPAATQPLAQAYQEKVRALPGMDSLLVPIGSGIELSRWAGA